MPLLTSVKYCKLSGCEVFNLQLLPCTGCQKHMKQYILDGTRSKHRKVLVAREGSVGFWLVQRGAVLVQDYETRRQEAKKVGAGTLAERPCSM